ncbi:MAG TPA: FHA domain-containing protein [Candidatus Krumholzibacteria bacterium]|nr:FHA domain-containing protein [Candidatus Krumholzibacteria bacterium]
MNRSRSTRSTPVEAAQSATSDDLSVFLARYHAALVILSGPHRGTEIPLDRPRIVIGRGTEADLVLADATVSRTHAVIGFRAGHFHVEDLDSANGTKVGCDAIGVRELEHGDHVRVGAVELQLIVEEREAPPPTHVLDVD